MFDNKEFDFSLAVTLDSTANNIFLVKEILHGGGKLYSMVCKSEIAIF